MDTNELVVGDWVLYKGNPIKVEEILRGCINPKWCCMELITTICEDEIEPIPLTEDILERNGFNRIQSISKPANEYFYRLTIRKIHEDKTYNTWLLEADNRGGDYQIDGDFVYDETLQGEVMNYKAKYVHELQHIMRLLKFPKSIEL